MGEYTPGADTFILLQNSRRHGQVIQRGVFGEHTQHVLRAVLVAFLANADPSSTHSKTHTLSQSLRVSPSLSLSLSSKHPHTHTHSLSLSHTHASLLTSKYYPTTPLPQSPRCKYRRLRGARIEDKNYIYRPLRPIERQYGRVHVHARVDEREGRKVGRLVAIQLVERVVVMHLGS
jgi:hypothetical protein